MLVHSDRHRPEDLELWKELEAADLAHDRTARVCTAKAERARQEIRRFVETGPCYCSVSWGKDSVVLGDLVHDVAPSVPLVWVRVEPIRNPDCADVRDAFLRLHSGCDYHEIEVWCERDEHGWHATGTLETGFRLVAARLGASRYLSGIRADESVIRAISLRHRGLATASSCRPLGWWSEADVFAYLGARGLPVHPAYGMLGGGRWDRRHLRVASLGGRRGDQFGRADWEAEYYGDVLRRLQAAR